MEKKLWTSAERLHERATSIANSQIGEIYAKALLKADVATCDECGYPTDPHRFELLHNRYRVLRIELSRKRRELTAGIRRSGLPLATDEINKKVLADIYSLEYNIYHLTVNQGFGKLKPCSKCKKKYNPTKRTRSDGSSGERLYPNPNVPVHGELVETLI